MLMLMTVLMMVQHIGICRVRHRSRRAESDDVLLVVVVRLGLVVVVVAMVVVVTRHGEWCGEAAGG